MPDDLPDKPPIDIPAEPVSAPTDEEEHNVPDEDYMKPEFASGDPTIDDEETSDGD